MNVLAETNRLVIRVFEAKDVDDAKGFWGNEDVMVQSLGAIPHEKLPKVIDAYVRCHFEKGLSVYAVVEKQSGKVIGAVGFNVIDSIESVELIYHFAKESWGKGYATEAAATCINIAKRSEHVNRIFASADPLNTNSLKVLEKIGFDFKGMKWFEDTKQEEPYYEMNVL